MNELKDNQVRIKGRVTFYGDRKCKNSDFTKTVLQILQTEDCEEPEYHEIDIWGKMKDKAAELIHEGDTVTATAWVNGSRKLWNERAFTSLSLSYVEVHGAEIGPAEPENVPADDAGDDSGDPLPF